MYNEFFGFSEKPFTITPNPRFIFLSKTHREVFAHLLYGIRQQCGFIELTGEVGTGKTTVLRTLMKQLEQEDYRLAYIFNSTLSGSDLLKCIHREFGIPLSEEAVDGGLLDSLNRFLLAENAAGRTVVLVIDEAQNLTPEVLEQVRLLSNLETETAKLIQIVLAGQPELGQILSRPELRQLSQRITVRYHLQPLDREDAEAYILHRLKVAGSQGRERFSADAMRRIFRYSQGLPRLINVLCDRVLLVAYAEDTREVASEHIRTAIQELRRESGHRPLQPVVLWLLLASVAALGTGWWLWPAQTPEITSAAASAPLLEEPLATQTAGRAEPVPAARLEELRRQLAAFDEGENAALAFSALAELWGTKPVREGGILQVPEEMQRAAAARDLLVAPFTGTLQMLQKIDAPVLLEVPVPGLAGWRYLAVVGIAGGRVAIAPPLAGEESISLEELRQLWFGRGYLLWRNYLDLPSLATPGTAGEMVANLQELLSRAGVYDRGITGRLDSETIAAITRFQALRGIAQDGRVGPQTLLLLYQADSRFAVPRISVPSGVPL